MLDARDGGRDGYWLALRAHPSRPIRVLQQAVKLEERVDFGPSERPEPEREDRSRGALTIPMTAGGVVLAYNLSGFEG